MLPAPSRSIRRLTAIALLLAPLGVPALADAQAASAGPASASAASLSDTPIATPALSPVVSPVVAPVVAPVVSPVSESAVPVAAPPFTAAGVAGVHTTVGTPVDALGRAEAVAPAALARRARSGLQQSQVLMVVGGAAVLLGLVTDGAASDFLLIGGAAVGLYGLYRYLQ